MGIKFRCPNGHKLNVKGFLAGKKGVCPDCGARFRIPLQEVEDDLFDGSAIGASGIRAKAPIPTVAPLKSHKAESSPTFDEVIEAVAVMESEQASAPAPYAPAAAKIASPAPPSIPRPHSVGDAIDENPAASWYVRPPSGGQYGPAQGQSMRLWLSEGRVTGASLVWREGWADWRSAAEVFPQLGPSTSVDSYFTQTAPLTLPPPVLAEPALAAPAAATRMNGTSSSRQGNPALTAAIFAALLLVGCGMIVVLIYLISQA